MTTVSKGINVVFSIDGVILGGQLDAQLQRTAASIDITNKINGEWADSLTGVKTWRLNCNGAYLKNSDSLAALETAFMQNKKVHVSFTIGDKKYVGDTLVIDFPINAKYGDMLKYNITLQGTGALIEGE